MNFLKRIGLIALAIIALIAAPLAASTPASAVDWKALAVNQQGDSMYSRNYGSEWGAKDAAINACEERWAYDCYQSSSVPMSWTLVAANCVNWDGDWYYSTGGSKNGVRGAEAAAVENANDNSPYWFEAGDCDANIIK